MYFLHLLAKFMLQKTLNEKEIEVWGSGKPLREFLYVNDLADAVTFCLENIGADDIYSKGISHLNCGSEEEVSISELMYLIQDVIGYSGRIVFDKSKPDGTLEKMDNSIIKNLGFSSTTTLEKGIEQTYNWYINNI